MDLILGQPPRLHPYFGYRNEHRLHISARALRSGKTGFERGGRLQAMRTMVSQFASREAPDLEVRLEYETADGTHEAVALTDREGFVHFDLELDALPYPAVPSWEVVALHWVNREGPQCIEGLVFVPGHKTRLGVISDIDDTIIETGITGGFRSLVRNWKRVLAQMPEERIAVPGADAFYSALGGGSVMVEDTAKPGKQVPTLSHRPFFYVSSSPWNLFSYLIAYKRTNGLPIGPVFLRDWGLNRATFGKTSHGAHKRDAIDTILASYPDLRFALIGDDTQGDLPAFAEVVEHNTGRIAAVFIRTAGAPLTPGEVAARATIEAANVPLWLGNTYETGQAFLRATGLDRDREATAIVEKVERPAQEA